MARRRRAGEAAAEEAAVAELLPGPGPGLEREAAEEAEAGELSHPMEVEAAVELHFRPLTEP